MAGPVQGIKFARNALGTPTVVRQFPEAASQTFKAGQILVFDRTLEAVKLAVVTTVTAMGIALEDASGTTGTLIHVQLFMPGDIYSATIANAGANAAASHDLDKVGDNYGWILSTETGETTKVTVNSANTTNEWFQVVDLDPRDTSGTVGGRVLFTVNPAVYVDRGIAS
jgi:hypothetical protein